MKIRFTGMMVALIFSVITTTAQKKSKESFSVYEYGKNNTGTSLTLKFQKGNEHNHPLFAVWLADAGGKYLQTLYVSESIGKGYYKRTSRKSGKWMPGENYRPATLPYWAHQRNVKNEKGGYLPTKTNAFPDAYTGATPDASFILHLTTENKLNGNYQVFLEVNQSWDWNEYWTNDKYPGDKEYKTSSQPALVYQANLSSTDRGEITLKPIGHSHYAGSDGSLNPDLSTLTTALRIASKITLKIEP